MHRFLRHLSGTLFALMLLPTACSSTRAEEETTMQEDLPAGPQITDNLNHIQKALALSPKLASVTDANGVSDEKFPEFILIQDVHNHPEVQSHIADMVVQAYHTWGVRKVFLEGAFSAVDLSLFQAISDHQRDSILANEMEQGDISGPELAGILLMDEEIRGPYTSPFQLLGVEDPELYKQNLAAYEQVLAGRPQAVDELDLVAWRRHQSHLVDAPVYSQQLARTRLLVELRLTPDQYTAYLKNKFATPSTRKLDPVVQAAERFYELVYERSRVFLSRAESRVPAAPGPRLLIVGGFHTSLMAEHLRLEGRSFVVLTPKVTFSGYQPLYEHRMLESMSALEVVKTEPSTQSSPTR